MRFLVSTFEIKQFPPPKKKKKILWKILLEETAETMFRNPFSLSDVKDGSLIIIIIIIIIIIVIIKVIWWGEVQKKY